MLRLLTSIWPRTLVRTTWNIKCHLFQSTSNFSCSLTVFRSNFATLRPSKPQQTSNLPQQTQFKSKPKKNVFGIVKEKKPIPVRFPRQLTAKIISSTLGVRSVDILKGLIRLGFEPKTVDDIIPQEYVDIIFQELNLVAIHDDKPLIESSSDKISDLTPIRDPIVTIMGHVNHGKTTLLDSLRNSTRAKNEAGGITQDIAAFSVPTELGRNITFIDTPGHEAFFKMRSRGSQLTDIIVLVIAADEGVMPQTVEVIRLSQKYSVPLIIAFNKIDKNQAHVENICKQLRIHGVLVDKLGGQVQSVEISAKDRIGLEALQEAIIAQADFDEIRAEIDDKAEGIILEANKEKGRGITVTALIKWGTLRIGNTIVCGNYWARVRTMYDSSGKSIIKALPSMPVKLIGFKDDVPEAGTEFLTAEDEIQAKRAATKNLERSLATEIEQTDQEEDEEQQQSKSTEIEVADELKELEYRYILKADSQGSLEAVHSLIERLKNNFVRIRCIQQSVGPLGDSDLDLTIMSSAKVICFNVPCSKPVLERARKLKIDVHRAEIIFVLVDQVIQDIEEMLPPIKKSEVIGVVDVLQVFSIQQKKKAVPIAGSRVREGLFRAASDVRILRQGEVMFEGKLDSLKHHKEDVKEVQTGLDCGLHIRDWDDYRIGDVIECLQFTNIARKLRHKK